MFINRRALIILIALSIQTGSAWAESQWVRYRIPGMNCHGCSSQIRNRLMAVPGVHKVQLNRNKEEVKVIYDDEQTDTLDLEAAMASAGFIGVLSSRKK